MTIKEIDTIVDEGVSLKYIAQAYSEIASLKVKKIRGAVERNRQFLEEISKVYGIIKAFAIDKKIALVKPKKRLSIVITSNYKFYGNINTSLINYFIGSTQELPDMDKIILGRGAVDYFRTSKLLSNYNEVLLKDDLPTPAELASLAQQISQYNQVLVFYSKFKSLLLQRATFADITAVSFYIKAFHIARLCSKAQNSKDKDKFYEFLFEPELPKVLQFFETQILTLLLEQTFLESELSRTASRFISMDTAQSEADKFIKEYQKLKGYTKRNLENNKILENYSSLFARKGIHDSI